MIEVALPGQRGRLLFEPDPRPGRRAHATLFSSARFSASRRPTLDRPVGGLLLDEAPPKQQVTRFSMSKRDPAVRAFLENQVHIATEHFGELDPLDLDEYLAHDGFAALRACLETPPTEETRASVRCSPEQLIATIEKSGLRGRGGAGFPSGQKWRAVRQQPGDVKYVICNGDEGDPGAFMDRMILESFPFRVIEGLALAAVAVGAHEGIFYVRHEYPLAVRRVRAAIAAMEKRGWLGASLLGAGFPVAPERRRGRRGVCLRRRDGADRLRRRPARDAAPAAALPRRVGPLGQTDPHQQRRNAGAGSVDRAARRGKIRRHRHRQKQRHQGLRPRRKNPPRRLDRSADGHDAAPDRRRNRRRRGRRTADQGGANRRAFRRLRARQPDGHAGGLRIVARSRRDHGFGRNGGAGRLGLHGGHRALFPPVHPGPVLRQMHLLPRRHEADAGYSGQTLRGQGATRAPGGTGTPGPPGQRRQPVRPGQNRPESRALDPALLPRRIRGPLAGPLPGRPMRRACQVSSHRRLHRLHPLRPALPGPRHPDDALRAARNQPGPLHPLRHLPQGLPAKRHRGRHERVYNYH